AARACGRFGHRAASGTVASRFACRRYFAGLVHGENAVGRGVAHEVEPAAAAGAVHPALGKRALRGVAHEEVLGPGLVMERAGIGRPRDICLAAVMELDFVARPAPWTRD